jgi:hypothetical protein
MIERKEEDYIGFYTSTIAGGGGDVTAKHDE